LDKAKSILTRYPSLNLNIGAHADDRGSDRYNLNLSRRRAKTIASYLVKIGVEPGHIHTEGYGESIPAVPCYENCSEDEHQKNRRAEFTLHASMPVKARKITAKPLVTSQPDKNKDNTSWVDLLAKYGDIEKQGLVFKISIGAYRNNHDLTFDQLSDLGSVESINLDGITYYFLTPFTTLKSAEQIRLKVIDRGITDAFISIYLEDKNITLKELTQKM
jgi:hypothetical protein